VSKQRPFWIEKPPAWEPSSEEYFSRHDLNGSGAIGDFRKSRRLYEARHINRTLEFQASEAMVLGSLVDGMITEPDEIDLQYAVTDAYRRGTAKWAKDEMAHPGKTLVKRELWDKAELIVERLLENPISAGILTGAGRSQVCHKWTDHGVPCRLRIDRVFETPTGLPVMVDLKVWRDSSPEWIAKDIYNRGTHLQMALYERGFIKHWGVPPIVMLVFAANTEPYEVATFQLPESFLKIGREHVEGTLIELGKCLESGDFSNPWETQITSIEPPRWAR